MLSKLRSRLSYSNVIATMALFIALGGGAYAAIKLPKNSVGPKQIKANAVDSSKVKNRSLLALDFKAGQLPAGAKGDQGLKGDKGDKGDTGTVDTSSFYSKSESDGRFAAKETSGIVDVPTTGTTTLLTHGSVAFTASCTDQGGGTFQVQTFAQSTETGAVLGRQADQVDLTSSPSVLDDSTAGAAVLRENSAAVMTPTTTFHALIARGVNVGGHNCVAGVTVTP
jgi:hypothetical protein